MCSDMNEHTHIQLKEHKIIDIQTPIYLYILIMNKQVSAHVRTHKEREWGEGSNTFNISVFYKRHPLKHCINAEETSSQQDYSTTVVFNNCSVYDVYVAINAGGTHQFKKLVQQLSSVVCLAHSSLQEGVWHIHYDIRGYAHTSL